MGPNSRVRARVRVRADVVRVVRAVRTGVDAHDNYIAVINREVRARARARATVRASNAILSHFFFFPPVYINSPAVILFFLPSIAGTCQTDGSCGHSFCFSPAASVFPLSYALICASSNRLTRFQYLPRLISSATLIPKASSPQRIIV